MSFTEDCAEANVVSATSTQLVVEVPFGVKSGKVSVKTPQGGEVFSPRLIGAGHLVDDDP